MWNFTPDPPLSKKKQRKSSLGKRSESNSLLRSTLRNARKRPVPETSEGTPHTDMVQTVKEFIEGIFHSKRYILCIYMYTATYI